MAAMITGAKATVCAMTKTAVLTDFASVGAAAALHMLNTTVMGTSALFIDSETLDYLLHSTSLGSYLI